MFEPVFGQALPKDGEVGQWGDSSQMGQGRTFVRTDQNSSH